MSAWRRSAHRGSGDGIEGRALRAVDALVAAGAPEERIGLGGSLLLGAQHPDSDIDLVVYGRPAFDAARAALGAAITAGQLEALDHAQWEAAWSRRGSDLTLDEYMKAEVRKRNKAVIEGTRLDLTLVVDHDEEVPERGPFRKLGRIVVEALVTDASAAFDHPARYRVQHAEVSEVVSFTPTYAGQAVEGETIEARGWLEEDSVGDAPARGGDQPGGERGGYVVPLLRQVLPQVPDVEHRHATLRRHQDHQVARLLHSLQHLEVLLGEGLGGEGLVEQPLLLGLQPRHVDAMALRLHLLLLRDLRVDGLNDLFRWLQVAQEEGGDLGDAERRATGAGAGLEGGVDLGPHPVGDHVAVGDLVDREADMPSRTPFRIAFWTTLSICSCPPISV